MKSIIVSLIAAASLMFAGSAAADMKEWRECMNQIKSETELQILDGKIDLNFPAPMNNQPFEILTNNSVPTEDEQKAILFWVSEQNRCMQLYDREIKSYPPALISVIQKSRTDELYLTADLYSKKSPTVILQKH